METDIKVFDTVESTNITLEKMAEEGATEGTCVVAFSQTKGQGRNGRTFYSPEGGNLYMSLLLRPTDDRVFDMITVMAAVAVVRAIRKELGRDCKIKWVNDIYLGNRKTCGIVAQAHNYGTKDEYVILGIGINIYEADNVPEDIRGRYGSIYGRKCNDPKKARISAEKLAVSITDEFSYYYDDKRTDEAVREYRNESMVIGRTVKYISGKEDHTANVIGIDDDGGIILEIEGERNTYRDGEIRISLTDK